MKYIKLRMALCVLFVLFSWTFQAQTASKINVENVVYTQDGKAIKGVFINSEKDKNSTFTDENGKFTLEVTADTDLIFSMEGYETMIVKASLNLENIVLASLNEKEKVQVAFRKVDNDELMGGVSYVDVAGLQNKNYFVNSLDNMDALASGFHGNIWGNNSYLILVDGLPRDANSVLATEIDQISFLKGVSAVALYGSRAAKGVVVITTKRGKSGKQTISLRTNLGMNVPKAFPKYLGSAEYMTLYNEARANDGLNPSFTEEAIYNHASGTNPYRYPNLDFYSSDLLKKGYSVYDATLEVSGGNEKTKYYTNLGYWREGSLIDFGQAAKNSTERINIRGNLDVKVNEHIKAFVDASIVFRNANQTNGSYFSGAATIRPNRFVPLIPISLIQAGADQNSKDYINNSEYVIDGKYLLGGTQLDPTNPFADLYAAGSNRPTNRQLQFNTGVDADLKNILKGLTFKTTFGIDYAASYTTAFNNQYATYEPVWSNFNGQDQIVSLNKYGQDASNRTQNIYNNSYRQTISITSQLNYKTQLADNHNFNAMLVAAGFQQSNTGVYHKITSTNAGLNFGYNFKKKYYLDFNGAMTHSTKLPEGSRGAFSPTGTLSWRVSNEGFMKAISGIDDLRLSLSGGIIHTDLDITDFYMYEGIYRTADIYYTWKDGLTNTNTASSRGSNPFLTYPKREEFSMALDGSLLNRLFTFNLNVFTSKMTGLITQLTNLYPNYFSTGYPESSFIPFENYNEDQRFGYDFNFNYHKKVGSFDLTFGVLGTFYESVAKKRLETNIENDYQLRTNKPIDAVWGLKSDGFFSSTEEITESPRQSFSEVKQGDIKYIDQNNDGVINAQDEVYLGRGGWSGSPSTLGVNITAKWNNFSLFILGTGRFGGVAMKNSSYFWVSGESKYSEIVRNRWTVDTQETASFPRLSTLNASNNFRNSDFWLYSTDRFDLSRVQLSYDFPKSRLKNTFFNELGFYVNGSNLLTVSANRDILEMNIGSTPQMRLYNIGLKANF